MNTLAICPCCSTPMIHYFHAHREAWFCRRCWQEMPNFSVQYRHHKNQIVNLSPRLVNHAKAVAV
ncbi:MAG: hypothetical protein QNJ18_05650 [Xenococcaceae cyanobacterium MO_167.B52]|nr:hypothetical protein [Xenococcaceae cyanobacterium MO_167.B52]